MPVYQHHHCQWDGDRRSEFCESESGYKTALVAHVVHRIRRISIIDRGSVGGATPIRLNSIIGMIDIGVKSG
jgi:hypothetical protein